MAGYDDTYQMIISTLMGRPVGTEIQPENQQAYEINMLNYIRSLELLANGPLIGIAEPNTQPIQPNDSRVCYIAGVAQDRAVTFQNFRNYLGQPIQITNGQMEACLVILIWDTQYWSSTQVPTSIISAAENANFYYGYNIRKTYPSVSSMNADSSNPIGADGKYIQIGELVSVVNNSNPNENGIYSYSGSGWIFQSSFNFQIVQNTGNDPNSPISQKGATDIFLPTNPKFIRKAAVATVDALTVTYPDAQVNWASKVTSGGGYIYWFNGTSWGNTGLKEFPVENLNVLTSSRIIAVNNPALYPELPIEYSALGTIVKFENENLPAPLVNMGLNYFASKTKAANNLEWYPALNVSSGAMLPLPGQYVRCSYIVYNVDNPPVKVDNTISSRSRLMYMTPSGQVNVTPLSTNISKLANKCYKIDLFYQIPLTATATATATALWLEIILETDNSIPTGRTVYLTAINFAYSDNTEISLCNELSGEASLLALQLARQLASSIGSIESRLNVIEKHSGSTKLNSSVVGGDFPTTIGNVSQNGSLYQTPQNSYLTDLGIKRMGYGGKNSSGNVELYIALNTELRQTYWDNNGRWCKVRWYIYSKTGAICTLTGNRLSVLGTGQTVAYSNNLVSYKKINDQVFEVTALFKINISNNLPSYIYLTSVWEAADVPSGFVSGDLSDGGVSIWFADSSEALDDANIKEDWVESPVTPDDWITIGQADERYLTNSEAEATYAQKSIVDNIASKFKLRSIVIGGNLPDGTRNVNQTTGLYANSTNQYLNNLEISRYGYANVGGNGNVECYINMASLIPTLLSNYDKWCRIRWYIYSKSGKMCTLTGNRLSVLGLNPVISYANGKVKYSQVDEQIFEVNAVFQIKQTTTPSIMYISSVWEAADVPSGFVSGDLGHTGIGMWIANTEAELDENIIENDWVFDENSVLDVKTADELYVRKTDEPEEELDYNNVSYNQASIAPFLEKYRMKQGDSFNQINVCLAGDSIFGRVDKSTGFNPNSPEISLTPDVNNPSESQPGYLTGHFPPNMWEQIVAFKVLEMLQFNDADVKYFNHVASEITKTGTWVDRFPVGADCIRTVTTDVTGSAITLSFNSATFCKFVYSGYGYNSATRKIQVSFSDDNGSTWKSPEDLGLTESLQSSSEGSGIYFLPSTQYKWGNLIWKGFDKSKSYRIKVEKIDTTGTLNVWGFETWSNPRINVIVTAEGGNTAGSQKGAPQRFYSNMYGQDLVIYELPYLNDLGVGMIKQFKGSITPSSPAPSSPVANDFYYCSQDGTYVNFGNITTSADSYIEWSGSEWRLGSYQIDNRINNLYFHNNRYVFERLSKQGVPVLTIITHISTSFTSRPYTQDYGLILLRLLTKQFGFACIDLNKYQIEYNINGIYSDGTHLNDAGVELYRKLIFEVLNPKDECIVYAYSPFRGKKLSGKGANSNSISFGFEMKGIPTVRLFNTSRLLGDVTNSGFTTTGTGTFDWEAFIE